MAAPKQNKMEDAKIGPFITLVKTSVDPNNEYPICSCKQCKCEPNPCPDGVCCGSYGEVPLVAILVERFDIEPFSDFSAK